MDLPVIDAATLYPRYDRGGKLYALDVIDGATVKPLIGEDGRARAARPGLPAGAALHEPPTFSPRSFSSCPATCGRTGSTA